MRDIYTVLSDLSLSYKRHDHAPFYTCDEADAFYKSVATSGVGTCKNLFLRNRKGDNHYLVILQSSDRADLAFLEDKLQEKGLSFASAERLWQHLGLKPGAVSPFGLINNDARDVIVVLVSRLFAYPRLCFHPNVNTVTLEMFTADFSRFLSSMGNKVVLVDK